MSLFYYPFRFMHPLLIVTLLIATSYQKCYHTKTIKTSLHRDTSPESYIKQNLSLWTINKTLIETAAYLKTAICETLDNNIIKCHKDKQSHLLNPLKFKDITHKLLMDNAKSFVSTPIYKWKENQTP